MRPGARDAVCDKDCNYLDTLPAGLRCGAFVISNGYSAAAAKCLVGEKVAPPESEWPPPPRSRNVANANPSAPPLSGLLPAACRRSRIIYRRSTLVTQPPLKARHIQPIAPCAMDKGGGCAT